MFAASMSFRMMATMMSLFGFPLASSLWAKALRSGSQRFAARAAI